MNSKAAAAAMLLGLLGAGARAAGDDASRQLQNLVYYPHAGGFRAVGQFAGSFQDSGNTDSGLGVQTASRSTVYTKADATLDYGVVDGLRVGVRETDLFEQKVETTDKTSGVSSNGDSHGFSDPTFTVAERYLDAPDDGFSGDVSGSFTPRLGRALSPGGGQSGNDLEAAWTATVSLPLYYRLHTDDHANEFELAPSVTRSFGGVVSGPDLVSSAITSSNWTGALDLSNRYHVNDSWYVQLGVTVTSQFSSHTASQAPKSPDFGQKTSYDTSPNLRVGYLPANWLLIEASVTYAGQGTSTYLAGGAGTTAEDAQTYGTLAVHAAF